MLLYDKHCDDCGAYFQTPKFQQVLCPECWRYHRARRDTMINWNNVYLGPIR